ncbi:hypothetical protein J2W32_003748 [Variovorax boronicumulans]|uniref:Uncharacterized protein n=1 Tax=Variovorax boronicumulans TaxID=436515 RepID=A0AAW8D1B1_9BURK|nr:hypothetical protein [Variovorax boronicumulans]MDP9894990.1 hypothetical protein [Variovorax boronicumulans]MDQ0038484.1 hypothetical protein [Variovorax boronicumulans]MDQ0044647.1 hypothetical protein [Variovorax boronicumulans]MDQ0054690.1 hypothetical protein [Variovorax boronicumulans]
MQMTGFSIEHGLILLIATAISGVPLWRIVARTGHPGIVAILFSIPLVNVGVLWWLAYGNQQPT